MVRPIGRPHRPTLVESIDKLFFSQDAPVLGGKKRNGLDYLVSSGWIEAGSPLTFGSSCGVALGISAARQSVRWVVAGPRGMIEQGRENVPIRPIKTEREDCMSPSAFKEALTDVLRTAREKVPGDVLAGAAIAWPCPIDPYGEPENYRNYHPDFSADGYSLRADLAEALEDAGFASVQTEGRGTAPGIAVDVINDADADLLYETRWGVAQGVRDALGVKICGGVGGAILIDGRLRRGGSGCCGEIEHIAVEYGDIALGGGPWRTVVQDLNDLPPCWCDGEACIDRFASGRAIIDSFTDFKSINYDERAQRIEDIGDDERVKAVFRRAGRLLARGLRGPVLALDPEYIVVTAFPRNEALLEGLRTELPDGARVKVEANNIILAGKERWNTAAGAARLVVDQHVIPRLEQAVLHRREDIPVTRAELPAWLRLPLDPRNDLVLQDSVHPYRGAVGTDRRH